MTSKFYIHSADDSVAYSLIEGDAVMSFSKDGKVRQPQGFTHATILNDPSFAPAPEGFDFSVTKETTRNADGKVIETGVVSVHFGVPA